MGIGTLEDVGHEYMETFLGCCERVLAEDGLFVLKGRSHCCNIHEMCLYKKVGARRVIVCEEEEESEDEDEVSIDSTHYTKRTIVLNSSLILGSIPNQMFESLKETYDGVVRIT
ncbi:hypothetical protein Tco_0485348 [Tanacetum coccineum]